MYSVVASVIILIALSLDHSSSTQIGLPCQQNQTSLYFFPQIRSDKTFPIVIQTPDRDVFVQSPWFALNVTIIPNQEIYWFPSPEASSHGLVSIGNCKQDVQFNYNRTDPIPRQVEITAKVFDLETNETAKMVANFDSNVAIFFLTGERKSHTGSLYTCDSISQDHQFSSWESFLNITGIITGLVGQEFEYGPESKPTGDCKYLVQLNVTLGSLTQKRSTYYVSYYGPGCLSYPANFLNQEGNEFFSKLVKLSCSMLNENFEGICEKYGVPFQFPCSDREKQKQITTARIVVGILIGLLVVGLTIYGALKTYHFIRHRLQRQPLVPEDQEKLIQ